MTPQFGQTFAQSFHLFGQFVQHDVSHPFSADFPAPLRAAQRRKESGEAKRLSAHHTGIISSKHWLSLFGCSPILMGERLNYLSNLFLDRRKRGGGNEGGQRGGNDDRDSWPEAVTDGLLGFHHARQHPA